MKRWMAAFLLSVLVLAAAPVRAANVLVEAESFKDAGGWVLDTQFIHSMGSPYLMAHGMGEPVKDATTTVKFPQAGRAFYEAGPRYGLTRVTAFIKEKVRQGELQADDPEMAARQLMELIHSTGSGLRLHGQHLKMPTMIQSIIIEHLHQQFDLQTRLSTF